MSIIADVHPFVVGVDTHARSHTLAVLTASGQVVDTAQFPATASGIVRAISWVKRRSGADPGTLWVIEGVATYGARLSAGVVREGYQVVEAARMNPRDRVRGKSDPLDAARIAGAVLALDETHLRHPREADGVRGALRVVVASRDHMSRERTAAINALTALVRTTDMGIDARRPLSKDKITQIARWRARHEPIATATARTEATRLAKRIKALDTDLARNTITTNELVNQSPARALLDITGIGPHTAAIALIAWSHPGRLRSEAAFAALAGVNPIPASSGNTTRHRLNRNGDRRLNRALHTATRTRMTHDPETLTYLNKRTQQGHTRRETQRNLKRYLARKIYRTLNTTPPT